MPTDQVRGLKAHGTSPAKTKLAGELLPLAAARFLPGLPCAAREKGPSPQRWVGARTGIVSFALLCLLCLALYTPGLAVIPPLDRDEARFAQATRQMLETGDFIRIRFQYEARNKKPI